MRDAFERAVETFDLVLPETPQRGGYGDLSGGGTGSSLEYQDHREYQPGDNVRRIDWKAYARTEEYVIKQYREEVSPVIEVILDGSRSMAITDEKKRFVRDLATLIARLGAKLNAGARVLFVGEALHTIEREWEDRLRSRTFSGRKPLPAQREPLRSGLRTGAVRYLITDGLFPVDQTSFLMDVTRGASRLNLLQTLAPRERDPEEWGGTRLVDVESGDEMDCLVSEETLERYRRVLEELCTGFEESVRALNGTYARLITGDPVMEQIRERLVPAEILMAAHS